MSEQGIVPAKNIRLVQLSNPLHKAANVDLRVFQQGLVLADKLKLLWRYDSHVRINPTFTRIQCVCVLEWMTRLKCFLGFQKMLSEDNDSICLASASILVCHLYSLLVVVANVSHCCNDEGYDRHSSNGANYNCHHVLF